MPKTYLGKDEFTHPIQALALGVTQEVSFAAGSSTATAADLDPSTRIVRVVCTVDAFVAVGPDGTVSAMGANGLMAALLPEYFRVPLEDNATTGFRVAFRGLSGGGLAYVTEMR